MEDKKEQSIVTIIQNMLSTGKSAEEIMQNLKEIGVPEEQAKTLLMIAQTNTLAVLKGDVIQMVNEQFAAKYPEFENQLTQTMNDKIKLAQEEIYKRVSEETKKSVDTYNLEQSKMVDKVVNISVEQDQKIELIKNKLNELGANYDKLALGSTKSLLYIRITSFVIGAILTAILVYRFFDLTPGYSIDYLIFYGIIGLLAGILLILSLI